VFRDEMTNLLPHDERARRMKDQTFIFPEFMDKKASDWQMPKLRGDAVVHVHCHQKALFRVESEEGVLKRLGLDYDLPNNGCCGLAGSFGFERDKYEVSMDVAKLELEPLLQKAKPETIVIADGFSCREQVLQASDREGLHVAEVIQMAVRGERPGAYPEKRVVGERKRHVRNSMIRSGAALLGMGALAWWALRKAA
jgi:Fe-S oxidoreductase